MDYVKKFLTVEGVIGQGAFGRVLVTSPIQNQDHRQQVALKCVHPILKPIRLANELRHLRDLGGQSNIVRLHTAHFYRGALYIVMEMIEHDKFVDFVSNLSHDEIKLYMKNLLIALKHVHEHNIVHRDIKPGNFLFNRKNQKFLLVDFGLAQKVTPRALFGSPKTPTSKRPNQSNTSLFHSDYKKIRISSNGEQMRLVKGAFESPVTPSRRLSNQARCDCRGKPKTCTNCLSRPDSNAPKSGTPGYKAPETLLRYQNQTTSVDVWSAGVILACLLSGHSPFFRDVDDNLSLAEMITILGSHKFTQAARALNIRLIVEPRRDAIDIKELCKSIRLGNTDKLQIEIPDIAFDLLVRMMDPNPLTRISASEALKHPWLDQ